MDKKTLQQFKSLCDFIKKKSEKCHNCHYRGYKTQNKAYCR